MIGRKYNFFLIHYIYNRYFNICVSIIHDLILLYCSNSLPTILFEEINIFWTFYGLKCNFIVLTSGKIIGFIPLLIESQQNQFYYTYQVHMNTGCLDKLQVIH